MEGARRDTGTAEHSFVLVDNSSQYLFTMLLPVLTALLLLTTAALSQPWQGWEQPKPNILFIFTDDQDLELGSLDFLPSVVSRVKDVGMDSPQKQRTMIDHAYRLHFREPLCHCRLVLSIEGSAFARPARTQH